MAGTGSVDFEETAIPSLKVMRLQSPEIHHPAAGALDGKAILDGSLVLPDSFGGEYPV
jgi:hypothetical protein